MTESLEVAVDLPSNGTVPPRFSDLFVEYAGEFTDCPPVFLRWASYLAISSVLGRKVYLEMGSWNVYPNIWLIVIGKSSSHKSTALSIVENLLSVVAPASVASSVFSEEYIIKALSESPQQLFLFDEVKSFFDLLEKKYNQGLKSLFTTLYRKSSFSRSTLGSTKCEIRDAYLTFGGASTPEWLRASLQSADQAALSGFLARFLMIPFLEAPSSPFFRPPVHSRAKFSRLCDMLNALSARCGCLDYSAAANRRVENWFFSLSKRQDAMPQVLSPFIEHLKNEAVHKLCLIVASDKGESVISDATAREVLLSLKHIEMTLPDLIASLSESDWDREHRRIAVYLAKHGTRDRNEVRRALHIHAQHLSAHLKGFEQDNDIRLEASTDLGPGRRGTKIIWIGER